MEHHVHLLIFQPIIVDVVQQQFHRMHVLRIEQTEKICAGITDPNRRDGNFLATSLYLGEKVLEILVSNPKDTVYPLLGGHQGRYRFPFRYGFWIREGLEAKDRS